MFKNDKMTAMKKGIDYIGVGVGAIILNKKKQVLLIKRSQQAYNEKGCWENPGGTVEFGELLEDAIQRELMEELGIETKIVGKLPIQECYLDLDKQHWISQTFVTKITEASKPIIQEPEKHNALKWFNLDDLPQPLSKISTQDFKTFETWSNNHQF